MAIGYTYITEIKTGRRTLYYGGRKTAKKFIPNYFGSGRVVKLIKKTGKAQLAVYLHSWHETPAELDIAERDLISLLRATHGKLCVNVNDGGDGFNSKTSALIEKTPSMKARRVAAIKNAWSDERRAAAADRARNALKNEEFRKAFFGASSKPEARERQSRRNRDKWQNDHEFRRQFLSVVQSEPNRRVISEGQTKAWKDEAIRARRSASIAKAFADPEIRSKKRKACQEACRTPEMRARRKEIAKELWSDPTYKARRLAQLKQVMNTPEAVAKRSAAIKAAWARRKALSAP